MSARKREDVFVTGLGMVSAAGLSVSANWQSLLRGEVNAGWFDLGVNGRTIPVPVYQVRGLETRLPRLGHLRRLDRSVQLAHVAAAEALAGLAKFDHERAGVFVGSSRGPVADTSRMTRLLPTGRLRAGDAPAGAFACLSGALSLAFELRGPSLTISATCTSGAAAIAMAAREIRTGTADLMLAGGADAPINSLVLAQLHAANVLACGDRPEQACRPFDANRTGLVPGEGAAFLLLESARSARRRGAKPLARLAGGAFASSGETRAGFDENGATLARVGQQAMTEAGVEPGQIDYVNLHGTGTRLNDDVEPLAMATMFGEAQPPSSSTKAVTGHCMGASSAMEAAISILALGHATLPHTVNCGSTDSPLDLVLGSPRPRRCEIVMSNSSGFWGTNAALIFSRP